jgi:hypothetical protein
MSTYKPKPRRASGAGRDGSTESNPIMPSSEKTCNMMEEEVLPFVVPGRLIPPKRTKGKFWSQDWMVEVTCPYCGKKHKHLAGDGRRYVGHRQSLCRGWNEGYFIVGVLPCQQ